MIKQYGGGVRNTHLHFYFSLKLYAVQLGINMKQKT